MLLEEMFCNLFCALSNRAFCLYIYIYILHGNQFLEKHSDKRAYESLNATGGIDLQSSPAFFDGPISRAPINLVVLPTILEGTDDAIDDEKDASDDSESPSINIDATPVHNNDNVYLGVGYGAEKWPMIPEAINNANDDDSDTNEDSESPSIIIDIDAIAIDNNVRTSFNSANSSIISQKINHDTDGTDLTVIPATNTPSHQSYDTPVNEDKGGRKNGTKTRKNVGGKKGNEKRKVNEKKKREREMEKGLRLSFKAKETNNGKGEREGENRKEKDKEREKQNRERENRLKLRDMAKKKRDREGEKERENRKEKEKEMKREKRKIAKEIKERNTRYRLRCKASEEKRRARLDETQKQSNFGSSYTY